MVEASLVYLSNILLYSSLVKSPSRKENNILQKFIRKFHEPLPSYDKVIEQWALTEEFKERHEKISSNHEYGNLPYTEDMAVRLDSSYRYQMFWYAIHYREAEDVYKRQDYLRLYGFLPIVFPQKTTF